MILQEVPGTQKNEYDNFVATNPSGSFLQSWEWGEWQSALGRRVSRFKILDNTGNQVASLQLIQMSLWGKKYYLYAPYGPVTDLGFNLPAGEAGIEDLRFLTQELQKKFANAVFLRIESKETFNFPSYAKAPAHKQLSTFNLPVYKSANIQPAKTLFIDLTKSQEQLLLEMHPKTRYNIKVAQKHGVEINDEFSVSVGHGLFFEEALKLITETAARQKFKTFSASYYTKMVDFFALHNRDNLKLHIYKAIFQNQLLTAAIMVDFGKTRTFLFGGSSEFHKNVMAPYLLHFQAMLDAKTANLEVYDFWGIETAKGDTPGFVRFKLGFGGQQKEYMGAYDMAQNNFLYKTYALSRGLNKIRKKFSPR